MLTVLIIPSHQGRRMSKFVHVAQTCFSAPVDVYMSLQIQMYQLSRLLHDYHRDLYNHLEEHEIGPSLYAAPWFLTVFASQFPLGFVARVFGELHRIVCQDSILLLDEVLIGVSAVCSLYFIQS